MKREMELCRKILRQVEEKSFQQEERRPPYFHIVEFDLPDYEPAQIYYQIKQLNQAGLLEGRDHFNQIEGVKWVATCLTWDGHEFLDAIKNDTVWKKITTFIKDKGGDIPFAILKELGKKMASDYFLGSAGS